MIWHIYHKSVRQLSAMMNWIIVGILKQVYADILPKLKSVLNFMKSYLRNLMTDEIEFTFKLKCLKQMLARLPNRSEKFRQSKNEHYLNVLKCVLRSRNKARCYF